MLEIRLFVSGLLSAQSRKLSDTPSRSIRFRIESLIISGSLQVLETVLRSRIPCPSLSSFFNLVSELDSLNICIGPGVLPAAQDLDALLRFLIEDPARFSILFTALVARGVIHSAEHISAGSGVVAHPLNIAIAGRMKRDLSMIFIRWV